MRSPTKASKSGGPNMKKLRHILQLKKKKSDDAMNDKVEEEPVVNEAPVQARKQMYFNRASPMKIIRVCKNFNKKQCKKIINSGFGSFLKIKCSKLDREACKYLMDHFNPDSCALEFGERGNIAITVEAVQLVLGIPNGPFPVIYQYDSESVKYVLQLLDVQDGMQPKVKDIEDRLSKMAAADDSFLLLWMIYVVCFLAPTTGVRVSPKCYPSLLATSEISRLNWCRFVINVLVKTANARNKKNIFKACMPLLMIKYVDSLETKGIHVEDEGARICVWTNQMVKAAISQDRNDDGTFGKLPLKPIFRSGSNVTNIASADSDFSLVDPVKLESFLAAHTPSNCNSQERSRYRVVAYEMIKSFETSLGKVMDTISHEAKSVDDVSNSKPESSRARHTRANKKSATCKGQGEHISSSEESDSSEDTSDEDFAGDSVDEELPNSGIDSGTELDDDDFVDIVPQRKKRKYDKGTKAVHRPLVLNERKDSEVFVQETKRARTKSPRNELEKKNKSHVSKETEDHVDMQIREEVKTRGKQASIKDDSLVKVRKPRKTKAPPKESKEQKGPVSKQIDEDEIGLLIQEQVNTRGQQASTKDDSSVKVRRPRKTTVPENEETKGQNSSVPKQTEEEDVGLQIRGQVQTRGQQASTKDGGKDKKEVTRSRNVIAKGAASSKIVHEGSAKIVHEDTDRFSGPNEHLLRKRRTHAKSSTGDLPAIVESLNKDFGAQGGISGTQLGTNEVTSRSDEGVEVTSNNGHDVPVVNDALANLNIYDTDSACSGDVMNKSEPIPTAVSSSIVHLHVDQAPAVEKEVSAVLESDLQAAVQKEAPPAVEKLASAVVSSDLQAAVQKEAAPSVLQQVVLNEDCVPQEDGHAVDLEPAVEKVVLLEQSKVDSCNQEACAATTDSCDQKDAEIKQTDLSEEKKTVSLLVQATNNQHEDKSVVVEIRKQHHDKAANEASEPEPIERKELQSILKKPITNEVSEIKPFNPIRRVDSAAQATTTITPFDSNIQDPCMIDDKLADSILKNSMCRALNFDSAASSHSAKRQKLIDFVPSFDLGFDDEPCLHSTDVQDVPPGPSSIIQGKEKVVSDEVGTSFDEPVIVTSSIEDQVPGEFNVEVHVPVPVISEPQVHRNPSVHCPTSSNLQSTTTVPIPHQMRLIKAGRAKKSPYEDLETQIVVPKPVVALYNKIVRHGATSKSDLMMVKIIEIDKNYIYLYDLADSVRVARELSNSTCEIALQIFAKEMVPLKKLVFPLRVSYYLRGNMFKHKELNRLFSDRLDHKEQIMFPTLQKLSEDRQDKSSHFFLVNLNLKAERFEVLDSLRSEGDAKLMEAVHALVTSVKYMWGQAYEHSRINITPYPIVHVPTPMQENLHDCGYFMLKFIESWDGRKMLNFRQKDMYKIRMLFMKKWLEWPENKIKWQSYKF